MAKQVFNNAEAFWSTQRVTPLANQMTLNTGAEEVDQTTFGDDTRIQKVTIQTASASISGFWDGSSAGGGSGPDEDFFNEIDNRREQPLLMVPNGTGTQGNVAYIMNAVPTSYNLSGAVGDLLGIDLEFSAGGEIVRGQLFKDGAENSDGNSSSLDLETVDSGEELVAVLYVLNGGSASDTLDVSIRSDPAGSPSDEIIFDTVTGDTKSVQIKRSSSTTSTSTYDAQWTISSGSSNWSFVVAAGVAAKATK